MSATSHRFKILLVIALCAAAVMLWSTHAALREFDDLAAAYAVTITPADILERYREETVKILIVPGHDTLSGGAAFGGLSEHQLTLALARELVPLLAADRHFEIVTARDVVTGEYVPELARYFEAERDEINAWRAEQKEEFEELVAEGELEPPAYEVNHGYAPSEVAHRLHAINKWANEEGIDIVLHLHFNDDPERRRGRSGQYIGFAFYVPERQYPNAEASHAVAHALFKELDTLAPVSNLPQESVGVVEDQELIAIGVHGSREGVSILGEYGYIYEPQFRTAAVRQLYLKELAWLTYRGLAGYFNKQSVALPLSAITPATFARDVKPGETGAPDVLLLQRTLQLAGRYDCPVNGNFGPCTEAAVEAFQIANGIEPTGFVGPQTRAKLNEATSR